MNHKRDFVISRHFSIIKNDRLKRFGFKVRRTSDLK